MKNYVDNDGILLPNVIEGKNSVSDNDLKEMWDSFKGNLSAISDKEYIEHTFNRYEINLNGKYQNMFLVLSEVFSMFPGWTAKADGKILPIERVDGVISAVYIDKPYKSAVFEYKPYAYVVGMSISIMTIILILVYLGYHFVKNHLQRR